MKVLNLQCGKRHSFEGWFGSEDEFQSQLARGLVECPLCADKAIVKLPTAPRLNFGGFAPLGAAPDSVVGAASSHRADVNAGSESASTEVAVAIDPLLPNAHSLAQQAEFMKAVRHVLANTEDVGDRFATQARAMHYGDVEPRSIRGQATPREAVELMEEGIEVMPLPVPPALKETLQ